jgi:hypothetical protein
MEGERTGNHIVSIHHELRAHGYVLVRGDIAHCSPLGNQARGPSKMPIVITYKDKETKLNVTQLSGGDRQKKETHPERSQRKDIKLSDQTEPARAKADITKPEDTQEPAKPKAKRDGEANIEKNSAASSVEIVDEIFNLPGQPVTREQESEDLEVNNKTGCPATPLTRGFVPPYTGTEPQRHPEMIQLPAKSPQKNQSLVKHQNRTWSPALNRSSLVGSHPKKTPWTEKCLRDKKGRND